MDDTTEELKDAATIIRDHGFVICEGEINGLPYVATAGLSSTYGHPELVVLAMHPEEASDLLSMLAEMVSEGATFEKVRRFGPPEAELASVRLRGTSIASLGGTLKELLGKEPPLVQIFSSDKQGLFPWEDGCDPIVAMQIFLPLAEEPPSVERHSLADARLGVAVSQADIAARRRAVVDTMKEHVEEHGWTLQSVFGSEETPPFTYTIGLSATYGHPEVYVCGLPHEIAQQLLATVCQRVAAGERFETPKIDTELANMPAAFRPVRDQEVEDNSAIGQDVLEQTFSAVQLFWPDPAGNMPWDTGCDVKMAEAQLSLLVPVGDPPAELKPPPGATLH